MLTQPPLQPPQPPAPPRLSDVQTEVEVDLSDLEGDLSAGLDMADGALRVETSPEGVLVTLRGDWDLTNASTLRTDLLTALHAQPRVLALDLSRVTLFDSTALTGLVAAWRRASSLGVPMRLVAPSSSAEKVLRITGIDRLIPIDPDTRTALAAV